MNPPRHPSRPAAAAPAVWAGLGLVALGLALRIVQFAADRSLWIDEAVLALNIVDRSFAGLTRPLDYNQGAPIGFLLIQKAALQLFGDSDYTWRLFPLVAGVAALVLMYRAAGTYLGQPGALAAVALFAVSGKLIYYASEAKQYSSDVLASTLILLLEARCLEPGARPRDYLALATGGVAAMWLSHPSVFVLAGVGLALALDALGRRELRRMGWLGLLFVIWAVNAGALYLVSLRSLTANQVLIDYWRAAFMPMPPWRDPTWVPNAFLALFKDLVGLADVRAAWAGLALALLGALSLSLRRRPLALALIVPFLLTLLASGLEKYPFGDRLLLFIVPLALLLLGEGIDRLRWLLLRARVKARAAAALTLVTAGLLLWSPASLAFQHALNPPLGEHLRPVLEYVYEHKADSDLLYVYYGAFPAFAFYAPRYGFEQDEYVIGVMARQEPDKYVEDLQKLGPRGQVWFIFAHTCNWCAVDEEPFFLGQLDQMGTRLDLFQAPGASAYLYRLGPPGQGGGAVRPGS